MMNISGTTQIAWPIVIIAGIGMILTVVVTILVLIQINKGHNDGI